MKFWFPHCFSELLNISRSIFISLDNLVLLSGMNNLFTTQVFALRFELRSNRVKRDRAKEAASTRRHISNWVRNSMNPGLILSVNYKIKL